MDTASKVSSNDERDLPIVFPTFSDLAKVLSRWS